VRFEFLLYDVTSSFFEGQALGNTKAARGYPAKGEHVWRGPKPKQVFEP
jgi:hypothetical protein